MTPSTRASLAVLGVLVAAAVASLVFLAARRDHVLDVLAHDGRAVEAPHVVMPSSDGEPFRSVGKGRVVVPAPLADAGRAILVTARGCGLLRVTMARQERLVLPPPIRTTIRVSGDFALPFGDRGLELALHAEGVDADVASVLDAAPAPASGDDEISVDPFTRSADVLLPCAGRWRVRWLHVDRERKSVRIVYARGVSLVEVGGDGEVVTLQIDPRDLRPPWDAD